MLMYFVLAWRNIWRNRNRTLITTASVFFAVILVLFMRSMQLGTYAHIIRNTVRLSTGFLQVQAAGFWEKRSIDNTFAMDDALRQRLSAADHVSLTVPRFEAYALAASKTGSRVVSILGIDPETENRMNGLAGRIRKGRYLSQRAAGVLIGAKLSETLGISVGDSLVLLGQGYHGISAAGALPVEGIVHLPLPELDSRCMFMTTATAQQLFAAPGRNTALAFMIDEPENMPAAKSEIAGMLPAGFSVKDWREMMPELVQSIEFDNAGGLIMLGILYLVIAFGIFGTVMMMAAERKREFAILVAVGMKRWKMSATVLLETVFIGLAGAVSGSAAAFPIVLYFYHHPIRLAGKGAEAMLQYGFEPLMEFRLAPDLFIHQAGVVTVIVIISSLYPIWSVGRFKIPATLRG